MAELEVPGQVILTLASSYIRELGNPTELMQAHDKAYRECPLDPVGLGNMFTIVKV